MPKKFLFLAVVLTTVLAGCANNEGDNSNVTPTPNVKTFSSAEVAEHATRDDCWMIIDGKVYDFSEYIPEHPAGGAMVPGCGKEATDMFDDVPHTEYARTLFDPYYLGELKD